jgi:hypothetical protein
LAISDGGVHQSFDLAHEVSPLVDELIVAGRGARSRGLVPVSQPSSGCQMGGRSAGFVECDHRLCL